MGSTNVPVPSRILSSCWPKSDDSKWVVCLCSQAVVNQIGSKHTHTLPMKQISSCGCFFSFFSRKCDLLLVYLVMNKCVFFPILFLLKKKKNKGKGHCITESCFGARQWCQLYWSLWRNTPTYLYFSKGQEWLPLAFWFCFLVCRSQVWFHLWQVTQLCKHGTTQLGWIISTGWINYLPPASSDL